MHVRKVAKVIGMIVFHREEYRPTCSVEQKVVLILTPFEEEETRLLP